MKTDELRYIQKTFQLHFLTKEGMGESVQANQIRTELSTLKINSNDASLIAVYCHALTESDPETKERYKELLFCNSLYTQDLYELFKKSALRQ